MNYAKLPTEAVHAEAKRLDGATTRHIVRALNKEDLRAVRAVGDAGDAIASLAEALVTTVRRGGRLYYVGAGTSGRLGALDAAEWPPTFGTDPTLAVAVIAGGPKALQQSIEEVEAKPREGAAAMRPVTARDLVIGITASGTTPFVLGALAAAKKKKATTALITCNPKARARAVDHRVNIDTGAEPATKLVLNAVSTAAMIRLGRIQKGLMAYVKPLNPKLRARAARIARELSRHRAMGPRVR